MIHLQRCLDLRNTWLIWTERFGIPDIMYSIWLWHYQIYTLHVKDVAKVFGYKLASGNFNGHVFFKPRWIIARLSVWFSEDVVFRTTLGVTFLRVVRSADGERIFSDITSSNWYAGAVNSIWTMNAAIEGVDKAAFTLLAINLESGLWRATVLVMSGSNFNSMISVNWNFSQRPDAANVTSFIDSARQVHPVYATLGKVIF